MQNTRKVEAYSPEAGCGDPALLDCTAQVSPIDIDTHPTYYSRKPYKDLIPHPDLPPLSLILLSALSTAEAVQSARSYTQHVLG